MHISPWLVIPIHIDSCNSTKQNPTNLKLYTQANHKYMTHVKVDKSYLKDFK